jgi:hypothetical protein
MSYVTFVLQKLFGYSLEKATELMLDVHEKGKAVVSSGTKEKAEMDVYRLHEHGLWATMQQDGAGHGPNQTSVHHIQKRNRGQFGLERAGLAANPGR